MDYWATLLLDLNWFMNFWIFAQLCNNEFLLHFEFSRSFLGFLELNFFLTFEFSRDSASLYNFDGCLCKFEFSRANLSNYWLKWVLCILKQNHGLLSNASSSPLDLKLIYERTKDRQDFAGLEFKVNYGSYPPLCFTDDGIYGIFVDYMKTFANLTNLKLVFQPPKPSNQNIWFQEKNGTIVGLLAEIYSETVDGSVAGFSYTTLRANFSQFSDFMYGTKIGLFIKTPQESEFSIKYYVTEFLCGTWILLCIVMLFIMLLLCCTMINIQESSSGSLKTASTFALATTYAAFLSKVRKMGLQDVQMRWYFIQTSPMHHKIILK